MTLVIDNICEGKYVYSVGSLLYNCYKYMVYL